VPAVGLGPLRQKLLQPPEVGIGQARCRAELGAGAQAAESAGRADPAGHRLGVNAQHRGDSRPGLSVRHCMHGPLPAAFQLFSISDWSAQAQLWSF
jgi:hypothetical protein